MAEIISKNKYAPRVDMTPMVDLGFLLVTFFMLTTVFTKLSSIDVIKPVVSKPKPLKMSRAITLIPFGKDSIFYFNGLEEKLKTVFTIKTSAALNQLLKIKAKQVSEDANLPIDERSVMIIVKPTANCNLQTLVKIMDAINDLHLQKNYALVDLSEDDKQKIVAFKN